MGLKRRSIPSRETDDALTMGKKVSFYFLSILINNSYEILELVLIRLRWQCFPSLIKRIMLYNIEWRGWNNGRQLFLICKCDVQVSWPTMIWLLFDFFYSFPRRDCTWPVNEKNPHNRGTSGSLKREGWRIEWRFMDNDLTL